ncbi:MAG TPA: EamA family transporter [Stellaceae bacterium]|jgi:drug/metabolite transporter (DMT)-like permease|nr:EamA family transporter [Stellaceae bacterium]
MLAIMHEHGPHEHEHEHGTSRAGAILALLSALLFGVTTPLAKLLLGDISPWLLAGLLYLGSGGGLFVVALIRRTAGTRSGEAPLRAADLPWLAGLIVAGGVAAPILLLIGLTRTPASTASLLLNLEGVFTIAIAWVVFREYVDRRVAIGAAAILLGAGLLSWQGHADTIGWSAAAVAAACLCWAIDSNLTRMISASDPLQITMIKGIASGAVNIGLALALHVAWPPFWAILAACVLGFFGYGVSLTVYIAALRALGTARTAAYYSVSPYIGAVVAIVLFGEPVTLVLVAAGALMAVGLYLHLAESHEHDHTHEAVEHEHRHVHDPHHRHRHAAGDPADEPHTHVHAHARLVHRHPHYPDLHHRHSH